MNNKNKKIIISVSALILLIIGIFIFYQKNHPANDQKMTMKQASKIGEISTHKLLVQIKKSGNSYERGDVIMVAPADREFSGTEKEIFLILKMDLTPKQADLLGLSLIEGQGPKNKEEAEKEKIIKRRKFYVDLEKAGIGPDNERGGEIEDRIFQWDILEEKEL